MDLKSYFQPLMKWWWMLAAACLLAAISSFIITSRQPPIYQAHTTLMVGQSINDPNPVQTQFYLEQQLAQIYANMAQRQPIQEGTMKALGLSWLPDFRVSALPNTQLVDIQVTDTSPARAQAVANEVAHQLMLRSPTVGQTEDTNRQDFIRSQLDNLQSQIKSTQDDIQKLREEIGNLNSARQIADKQNEISSLENKLTVLQANYATMLGNSKQGAPNSLSVIEPAELPTVPVGPNRLLSVVLSSVVGLLLASLGAYALEFLDPTFRTVDEVSKNLAFPLIGHIGVVEKDADFFLYVVKYPLSPVADGFRSLKNTLEIAGVGSSIKSLQVISAETGEGKSTISANLAATFAKSGKKVILVDADLRKRSLTRMFELTEQQGLYNVLSKKVSLKEGVQSTAVNNLSVLPAGVVEDNPIDVLNTVNIETFVKELEHMAEVVIYDSPPTFISDSLTLIRKVVNLIYVVRLGRSRRDVVKKFKDEFGLANVQVIGTVVNGLPKDASIYGRRYHKYASYYNMSEKSSSSSDGHHETAGMGTSRKLPGVTGKEK